MKILAGTPHARFLVGRGDTSLQGKPMVSLIVGLILSGPIRPVTPPKHCIMSCMGWKDSETCWYDWKVSCGATEVCINSASRTCKPWRVQIGEWDPVGLDYEPMSEGAAWHGTDPETFVSHLNDETQPVAIIGYPPGMGFRLGDTR